MALQRKRPSDDEILNNQAISDERVPGASKDDSTTFSTFDEVPNIDKTTLDLDAFAPYKPAPDSIKNIDSTISRSVTNSDIDFSDFTASPFATVPDEPVAPVVQHPKDFDPSALANTFEGSLHNQDFDAGLLTEWSTPTDVGEPRIESIDFTPPARPSRLFVQIGKFSANYDVVDEEMVIGRPDYVSDIHPEITIEWDDAISRRHARVFAHEGEHYIEDLGSTNGTKLNGYILAPHSPHILSDGDVISLGSKTELSFYK